MSTKIDEIKSRAAEDLTSNVNELLADLIIEHTGAPVDLVEVQGKGRLIREADGSETYAYGGVPLLRLYPMKISHGHDRDGVTIRVEQKYEILKARKNG